MNLLQENARNSTANAGQITKVCRVCGRRLAFGDLVTDSHASFGVKAICKACYRDERKSYPSYPRKGER